jgi:hypothetical protein
MPPALPPEEKRGFHQQNRGMLKGAPSFREGPGGGLVGWWRPLTTNRQMEGERGRYPLPSPRGPESLSGLPIGVSWLRQISSQFRAVCAGINPQARFLSPVEKGERGQ